MFIWFIFSRIKKGESQGKEKSHAKSMMSNEAHERLKIDTQHVPLRQFITSFFYFKIFFRGLVGSRRKEVTVIDWIIDSQVVRKF